MAKTAKKDKSQKVTPMVRQYNAVKARYPNYILMFRMGDFYEMFHEDAERAAELLGITLTRRPWGDGRNVPLAGVPYHAVETYLAKFIRAGQKVAICDQVEDPKQAKGIVKREVTRIVTPGTILESDILEDKSNNFLAALAREGETWGLAVTDLSTGAFEVTEFSGPEAGGRLFSEIGRLQPAELLLPEALRRDEGPWSDPGLRAARSWLPDGDFEPAAARRRLLEQFRVQNLEGFGAAGMGPALAAAGALVLYLRETQLAALEPINQLRVYNPSDFLVLDYTTQRSLELLQPLQSATSRDSTLVAVLDRTATAMGGRLLRGWMLQPLKEPEAIARRQDAVEELFTESALRTELSERLGRVHDLERIVSRVGMRAGGPRDLAALRASLEQVAPIREILERAEAPLLAELREGLDERPDLLALLRRGLAEAPPPALRDGGVIAEGFHEELDELRRLAFHTQEWMEQMRQDEIARTGIPNLKIKYNKVFGFFIEVSKGNLGAVPEHYIRKQTLVNAERFITPELKEKEEVILNAQERIASLEYELFEQLRQAAAAETREVQALAARLARLDCLHSLAAAAIAGNFTRPVVDAGDSIEIRDGRHPVVEALQGERPFVPNDVRLSNHRDQVWVITGPNMAGKSTFIRQVALLTLMAQMGSFIPASQARIGVVDRIFTRVGAMDSLVRGQSTFLVEMTETANILNNATDRSLVILDEIGRGTSTYDGLSIAWAVVEYLHATQGRRPKTLFATHYHELAELEDLLERVWNHNVAVLEQGGEITFLYKIQPGSTDHSYGIYAGKVAGLPPQVIDRAGAILHQLEFGKSPASGRETATQADRRLSVEAEDGMMQLSLFDGISHPVLERLKTLDADRIAPIEALRILGELIDQAR